MLMKTAALVALLTISGGGVCHACSENTSDRSVDFYPTNHILPENLLRIYIYFPRPMGRETKSSDLTLLDQNGSVLNGVFLSPIYDLWSPDRTRLTLLLNPGRVKTGLHANTTQGRALTQGESYTLKVPGELEDSFGCPLGANSFFSFSVGPSDFTPPDPSDWVIDTPRSGTRMALNLDLGSSHDHLSMAYRIRVLDDKRTSLPGAIRLKKNERVWSFIPEHDWSDQFYLISIDPSLEDLAGNRPGGLFDHEIGAPLPNWTDELRFKPSTE